MDQLTIPLFPLHTVLFPGGLLPLRVFEVRYLEMIGRAIADGSQFGVIAIQSGSEVRLPDDTPQLAEFGTMAAITSSSAPQPALLEITCTGGSRFHLLHAEQQKNGLWMGTVETLADDREVAVPGELHVCARRLQEAFGMLAGDTQESDLPFAAPVRYGDCGWVANRWCELLPLALNEKIRLLSLDNPLLRLELVQDLLDEAGWLH
ncbi:MAG TPA: LON peptidase substrate-binding domain-containing protein [Burkholderiaceae bacterium]